MYFSYCEYCIQHIVELAANSAKECCYKTPKFAHSPKNGTYYFCKSVIEYFNDIACNNCINLNDFKKLPSNVMTSQQFFTKLSCVLFLVQHVDFVYDLVLEDIFHAVGFF